MSPWSPFLWLAILSPLLILAHVTSQKTNIKYLIYFIVYMFADTLLNIMGTNFFQFETLNFNWSGKFLSLGLALVFILFHSKKIRREIGFTTKFQTATLKFGALIFIGILLIDFVIKINIFPKGGDFDPETFLYQSTMPGVSEELVYRGIYFWLLDKAFVSSKIIKGIPFGWGFVISTLLFGIVHGVQLTESFEVSFDLVTIVYLTLISSLSLGLLRKFTGNLILPVFGHNIINVMNSTIRIL